MLLILPNIFYFDGTYTTHDFIVFENRIFRFLRNFRQRYVEYYKKTKRSQW